MNIKEYWDIGIKYLSLGIQYFILFFLFIIFIRLAYIVCFNTDESG